MTKLRLSKTAIYRVPRFSYTATLTDCWEELKLSIRDASKAFYQEIAGISASEICELPDAHQHTIWKYCNRAKFRATPFGSFAAIGAIELNNNITEAARISAHQNLHRFLDWTCAGKLSMTFDELIQADALLYANSSYYFVGSDIRYIGHFDNRYELSDLPQADLKVDILKACAYPQRISTLLTMLSDASDRATFLELLETMVADQLLISEMQPNIIGQDYFQRIGLPADEQAPAYIIAGRSLEQGALDQQVFKHLPGLMEKLYYLLPVYSSPELEQFKQRFTKRFDSREIPLMVALDPELGVGYGGMDEPLLTGDLIKRLAKPAVSNTADINNPILRLLLPKLIKGEDGVIDLDSLEIPKDSKTEVLPNSLPVLCTLADGMIMLDYLGGCTATALAGRFTLASDVIWNYCRQIAGMEQRANPDVLFFDVGYTASGVVDNVNRRKSIYNYQLNIFNYDTSDDPLTLNELLLSVQNGELVIRSQRHNKRVVPRLASAYNYLLSDLPVFRLLCDLQYQGIQRNGSLRLRDHFANLDYYPRLMFKNIVISPATWLIRLEDIKTTDNTPATGALAVYLEQKGVSRFVKFGHTDQTLCIDTCEETELDALLKLLRKQKLMYLEETIIPQHAAMIDTNGKPYLPQLLLTLQHDQNIYIPVPTDSVQPVEGALERIIVPGDEWLYFEIFCHPMRADWLLTGSIKDFLEARQEQIMRWFFIRYTEGGDHIRLRLRLRKTSQAQQVMSAFTGLMKDKIETGLVSDMSIRLYRRELERYGADNIFFAEVHFHLDSRFVLNILQYGLSDEEKYLLCIELAIHVREKEIFSEAEFSKIIEVNSNSFNAEHGLDPVRFKLLNVAWQKFSDTRMPELDDQTLRYFNAFKSSFIDTLYQYPVAGRADIFNSLFHMHVNRMFPISQRMHETVIYYFLEKYLKRTARTRPILTGF